MDLPPSFMRADADRRDEVLDKLAAWRRRAPRDAEAACRGLRLGPGLFLGGSGGAQHGGVPPLPSFFDTLTAPDMPIPFRSPIYEADIEAIVETLDRDVENDELLKISKLRANDISSKQFRRGHMQGVAMGAGRVLTSVEEKAVASDDVFGGHLQIFADPINDGDSAGIELDLHDDVPGDHWPHAVIGQGVLGKAVSDSSGVLFPDEIGMLCPLTHGIKGATVPLPPFDGAPTDLRDRNGRIINTFWHRKQLELPHEDDGRPELQAPATIVFNDRLYLVSVRHEFLYVYELIWMGGANADAMVAWDRKVAIDTSRTSGKLQECITRHPSGNPAKFENYDAVNLLLNAQGHVLLLGSHARWCDIWHLGVLNPPGGAFPVLTKMGFMEQNWVHGTDLFEEGLAIGQPNGELDRIGFLAAPFDYRHSRCTNPFGNPMCTHLWFFERQF